jgi:hypothetical protein
MLYHIVKAKSKITVIWNIMMFKDLRNRFSNSQHVQQQTTTYKNKAFGFEMLKNIGNKDIKTKRGCCFNCVIGLSQKNGVGKNPHYD